MESEYEEDPSRTTPDRSLTETLICDWGSSRLRAYLVDERGEIRKRHESEHGVKHIAGGAEAYAVVLKSVLEQLGLNAEIPIRISGMAGSKKGWVETDYHPTPAGQDELARNFIPLPGFENGRLYGGLKYQGSNGSIDVMRGEEIQVLGIINMHQEAQLICLPGTHSKWVRVEGGRITGFKTYMTGDLFHSLCEHSIFREQIATKDFDREGFLHGCRLANEGSDLNDLFRLRTEFVFAAVSEQSFHSCLSGFLIANELKAAKAQGSVHLCGSTSLIESYALALEQVSIPSQTTDSEAATILGHLSLTQP